MSAAEFIPGASRVAGGTLPFAIRTHVRYADGSVPQIAAVAATSPYKGAS